MKITTTIRIASTVKLLLDFFPLPFLENNLSMPTEVLLYAKL